MQIDTVVYFQITDAKLYTYGVENADELTESKNLIKCNSIKEVLLF